MMKIVSLLSLALGTAAAFTTPLATTTTRHHTLFATATDVDTHNEQFFRAIKLAGSASLSGRDADLEELDKLATELENVEGCDFEDEFCDKEIQDRVDVAEILRLRIELLLR